jgi:hypothetical protein
MNSLINELPKIVDEGKKRWSGFWKGWADKISLVCKPMNWCYPRKTVNFCAWIFRINPKKANG